MVLFFLSYKENSLSYIFLKVAVFDVRVVKICLNGFFLIYQVFWVKINLIICQKIGFLIRKKMLVILISNKKYLFGFRLFKDSNY